MKLVKLIDCFHQMVRNIYKISNKLQTVGSIYEESKGLLNMAEKEGRQLKREKYIYHGQIYFKFNYTMCT